jgi:carboxypeptidase Taq
MVNKNFTKERYQAYTHLMQKIADLKYSAAVLQWDQETYMPAGSAEGRARQLATLTEMAHSIFVAENTEHLLEDLLSDEELGEKEKLNVSLSLYDYRKEKKLSAQFVRQLSEATSRGFQSWVNAKKQNEFSIFESDLDTIVTLKKSQASLMGYQRHPYDALLNDYERGCTTLFLDSVFSKISEPLQQLIRGVAEKPQVDDSVLKQHFPKDAQYNFGMELLTSLGFDFNKGRQDISEHPFTTSFGPSDVRVTTRVHENDFNSMTWSCIHELGHALYEQGLPDSEYGLPLGEYTSLSIHESQSRLWENNVGRSHGFWKQYYPVLQKQFPDQFANTNVTSFYSAINKVEPSLIRTEADELTYHFHVIIRYNLEKELIEGTIQTKDIPQYWREAYEKYLGVKVPDDQMGCLQDVHWSHGSFGYFPTYSLGSLYAAQFYAAAEAALPGLNESVESGHTQNLLDWLRRNIHSKGREFTSDELCTKITGKSLDPSYFMKYATAKYGGIYGI